MPNNKMGHSLSVALCVIALPASAAEPPLGGEAMVAWLKAGDYKQWPAEHALHDSQGQHFGKVRAYLNPPLYQSMVVKAAQHPKGAVAVKELYGDGKTLRGWSVAIKTAPDSDAGANWYWYEIYDGTVIKDAQGALLCRSCHFTGYDYVLTPWPLR